MEDECAFFVPKMNVKAISMDHFPLPVVCTDDFYLNVLLFACKPTSASPLVVEKRTPFFFFFIIFINFYFILDYSCLTVLCFRFIAK